MKSLKKILIVIIAFIVLTLIYCNTLAVEIADLIVKPEYSEEYKRWLELSEEEREGLIEPRLYQIPKQNVEIKNPLKMARMLKSNLNQKYSLKETIPENVIVKDQATTNSCWTFGALSSLETNLALIDYYNGEEAKAYDFSERHMEYATSREFQDGQINQKGLNRKVGSGGNRDIYIPYLTNGAGAIDEIDMPFEDNQNLISLDKIQNKEVKTQVYDTIDFPTYRISDDLTQIKQQMKQHIMNYGSIEAGIHGAGLSSDCLNTATGAIYCKNTAMHQIDHSVSIIGWDDNYSIDNFNENSKPTTNGAWIIKNSWGTEKKIMTLDEYREGLFKNNKDYCISQGWNDATQIPEHIVNEQLKLNGVTEENGYKIQDDSIILKMGDNGIMYVSYEDVNVYTQLTGIVKSSNNVGYENIYQYNEYTNHGLLSLNSSKIYLANVFQKKGAGKEYITQVSIYAPETYTCKVYVNPNGTSKLKQDLQLVQLKSGEAETFEAGYHTMEFLEPIEIKANNFVVMIEIQGKNQSTVNFAIEANFPEVEFDDVVVLENDKCFVSYEEAFEANQWQDISKMTLLNSKLINGDSTIKAFTVSSIPDNSLKDIEITTPPTKLNYIEGDNFDRTGMIVKANYNNGKTNVITDYSIKDGTNLKVEQKSVTIEYEDKTANQEITVEKNSVVSIRVKTPPNKTEYFEGENFDKTGIIIEATYKNGDTKEVTDYTITNGEKIKAEQTDVIIEYEGKTTTQPITVKQSDVASIIIKTPPEKKEYYEGEDFDKTGMVVEATYKDNTTQELDEYTVLDGENLKLGQTNVTINFEGKETTQDIKVNKNSIVKLEIKTPPTKTVYHEGEDFDKTGMVIVAVYENGSIKELTEYDILDGINLKLGQTKITISFEEMTVIQEITVNKVIQQPQNSNFENIQGNIKSVKAYYYSDKSKKDYIMIDVQVNNIEKNETNDKLEYYYYLSPNQDETNINKWTKIEKAEIVNGKLNFTINTQQIPNYEEVSNSDVLYLYIKEIAIKGEQEKSIISKSIKLDTNVSVETFVDDVKKENIVNPGKDNTVTDKELPNTGIRIVGIILLIVIMLFIIIKFVQYRRLKDI